MHTQRLKVTFTNQEGMALAGLLELPVADIRGYALFAHCFTCGKDIHSASRIARGLANAGFATLRFDFTGLGSSDGDFANTNFSSNVEDLVSAANFLTTHYQAPEILIGHSLGGAAVIAAAAEVPSAKAIITIGAPADPGHLVHTLSSDVDTIEQMGVAEVTLAGRRFRLKKQFIDDLRNNPLTDRLACLKKALLVFHSPIDQIVSIDEAAKIYQAAKHPKSFVSLDTADHLVTAAADAAYIADTLAAWVKRYTVPSSQPGRPFVEEGQVLVAEKNQRFTRAVFSDTHQWYADEPAEVGGDDLGPDPYEHLLAALGACTSMTIRMYANHKKWPLADIHVALRHQREHQQDCTSETPCMLDVIERSIRFEGDELTAEQRKRLLEIADRCPVHRTLENEIQIKTREA